MIERKTFDLVGSTLSADGSGSFAGFASCFGVKDSQGDIVVKGAYRDTLDQFVARGFISWNHDWGNPVATIKTAREEDQGLYVEADFHSDPASQQARIRTQERVERGKFMGLSIGYAVNPGGAEPTKDARYLRSLTLYETGLVTVPSCAPAGVTAAKAAKYGGLAGMDAEPPEGSYEELTEDLAEAYAAANGLDPDRVQTVATFAGHAVLCVLPDYSALDGPAACTYWDVPYTVGADDDALTLGAPQPVDPQLTYVPSDDAKGLVLPLCALQAVFKRGAPHSKPTRERYAAMMTHATALVDHIGSLQRESAPADPPSKAGGRRQLVEYLAWEARRLGVAV
jgi:HK97 family phage prohead protease